MDHISLRGSDDRAAPTAVSISASFGPAIDAAHPGMVCTREGSESSYLGDIKSRITTNYAGNVEDIVASSSVSDKDLSLLLRNKHGELRGAIHCAQGLFEANVDCLANVMRLQRENSDLSQCLEAERLAFKGRELALLELVRGQQRTIASLQRMVSIGAVWGKLINPTHLGSFEGAIMESEASSLAEASSMVLAWLSVCCVRQAGGLHNGNKNDFSIDIFARQVADALASAESEILRLSGALAGAEQEGRRSRVKASEAEREISDLKATVASLESAHRSSESVRSGLESEVRRLRRDLEAARAEALRWREDCDQMNRTLRLLDDRKDLYLSSPDDRKSLGTPYLTGASQSVSSSDAAITPLPRYERERPVVASAPASRRGGTHPEVGSPLDVKHLDVSPPQPESDSMQQRSQYLGSEGMSIYPDFKTKPPVLSKAYGPPYFSLATEAVDNAGTSWRFPEVAPS